MEHIVREAIATDRSADARIAALAARIAEDPARATCIEALAARAAMSRRNLERRFRRVTGLTPARFVQQARIALARRLLAETSMSAKAVALRCGFGNAERMRRAFQRRFGMSPGAHAASEAITVPPKGYGAVVCRSGSYLRLSV